MARNDYFGITRIRSGMPPQYYNAVADLISERYRTRRQRIAERYARRAGDIQALASIVTSALDNVGRAFIAEKALTQQINMQRLQMQIASARLDLEKQQAAIKLGQMRSFQGFQRVLGKHAAVLTGQADPAQVQTFYNDIGEYLNNATYFTPELYNTFINTMESVNKLYSYTLTKQDEEGNTVIERVSLPNLIQAATSPANPYHESAVALVSSKPELAQLVVPNIIGAYKSQREGLLNTISQYQDSSDSSNLKNAQNALNKLDNQYQQLIARYQINADPQLKKIYEAKHDPFARLAFEAKVFRSAFPTVTEYRPLEEFKTTHKNLNFESANVTPLTIQAAIASGNSQEAIQKYQTYLKRVALTAPDMSSEEQARTLEQLNALGNASITIPNPITGITKAVTINQVVSYLRLPDSHNNNYITDLDMTVGELKQFLVGAPSSSKAEISLTPGGQTIIDTNYLSSRLSAEKGGKRYRFNKLERETLITLGLDPYAIEQKGLAKDLITKGVVNPVFQTFATSMGVPALIPGQPGYPSALAKLFEQGETNGLIISGSTKLEKIRGLAQKQYDALLKIASSAGLAPEQITEFENRLESLRQLYNQVLHQESKDDLAIDNYLQLLGSSLREQLEKGSHLRGVFSQMHHQSKTLDTFLQQIENPGLNISNPSNAGDIFKPVGSE